MTAADRITRRLTEAFRPAALRGGGRVPPAQGSCRRTGPEGETHFRVRITAEAFRGKSRVEAHRMVNAALAGEFARGLHALAIEAKAPASG